MWRRIGLKKYPWKLTTTQLAAVSVVAKERFLVTGTYGTFRPLGALAPVVTAMSHPKEETLQSRTSQLSRGVQASAS